MSNTPNMVPKNSEIQYFTKAKSQVFFLILGSSYWDCQLPRQGASCQSSASSRRKAKNIGHDRRIWLWLCEIPLHSETSHLYQIWMFIPCHKKRCVQEWGPEIAMWKHYDTPLEWGGPPFVPDLKNQNTWSDPSSQFQSWPLPSVGLFWWHPLCWESSVDPVDPWPSQASLSTARVTLSQSWWETWTGLQAKMSDPDFGYLGKVTNKWCLFIQLAM